VIETIPATTAVGRRLRPVFVAAFLQNVALWVPIEKLFMTEIGFDNGSVAVMAAVYAAIVPVLEVPSGILADRWSRRGVAVVALSALLASVVVGGLSTNVATYVGAAALLGVFFAMQSGTLDSIVYDTLLEETGDSSSFERTIGRLRFIESAALVLGALVGGLLAEVVPLRATYFLTVPFIGAAIVVMLRFDEPALHRAEDVEPLRRQVATTYRTLLHRDALRPIVGLLVLTALLLQVMLEFGPLWMVALAAPAALYGPQWAGLMSALGLGGLLGGRLELRRWASVATIGAVMVACSVTLATSRSTALVILAQVVLVVLVVAVGIPVTRRLHDAIPSSVRAGVASGVGTLTWLTFLPFALLFGAISDRSGVHDAGWTVVAVAAGTAALLLVAASAFRRAPAGLPLPPPFADERFLPADDPEWPGHWASPPAAWPELRRDDAAALATVRAAIDELPSPQREVVVGRDVEGRSAAHVAAMLDLDADAEQDLLDQARGHLRNRLDDHLVGGRE
jgi:MFS family permease